MTTHIHIPDVSPVVQITADGSQKVFAFPFPIFWDSDLEVRVGTSILMTGFTVFGAGSSKGGAVVLAGTPMAGTRVTLRRKQTYARTDDFLDERAPTPHELNDAVDQNVAAIQELAEQVSRSVQRPLAADLSQPVALDLPTPEANKILGWNGSANGLVNIAQIDPSNVLHRDQNLADLLDKPAARINLGLGSVAAHAESDFATAAQGVKADTALQSSDVGVSVQAHDADLDWLAANLSAAGRALVDDADANAQRVTLGLAAVAASGSYADLSNKPTLGSAAALNIDPDATLAANSDALLPSQKAVKAYVTAQLGTNLSDQNPDIGQLYLAVARLDTSTAPNAGGTQVADEFDDATGIGSLGSATIDRGYIQCTPTGSVFGSMTGGAGLSAAFNDVLTGSNTGGAYTSPDPAYVGKSFTSGQALSRVIVYGSDSGNAGCPFSASGDTAMNVVLSIYGKNGVPANGTDGTLLATASAVDTMANRVRVFDFASVAYTHFWVYIEMPTASSSVAVAEVQYYASLTGYLTTEGGFTQYTPTGSTFGDMTQSGGLAAAFDATPGTYAYAYPTGYVGKAFTSAQTITKVTVQANNQANYGWASSSPYSAALTIYGKSSAPSSGTDGTVLGSLAQAAVTPGAIVTIPCSGSAYQYVWVYGAGGNDFSVAEVKYYTTNPVVNITTVSNVYTAQTAPGTVSFVVEYQDISTAAVLNTDITLEASRDNGTTWTSCTLTDFGPSPISGARVLKAGASVAGQPSGTAIKWRIKTFNTKEQRIHGLWMQWK